MNECSECVPLRLLGLVSLHSTTLAWLHPPDAHQRNEIIWEASWTLTVPQLHHQQDLVVIGHQSKRALQLNRADCRNRRKLHKDSNRLIPLGALVGQKKVSQLPQITRKDAGIRVGTNPSTWLRVALCLCLRYPINSKAYFGNSSVREYAIFGTAAVFLVPGRCRRNTVFPSILPRLVPSSLSALLSPNFFLEARFISPALRTCSASRILSHKTQRNRIRKSVRIFILTA